MAKKLSSGPRLVPVIPVQFVPVQFIKDKIYRIRGHRVMLDSDLAEIYQVPIKTLSQAVRRNPDRFPPDFMFQLNAEELENWRSQIVASNPEAKIGLRRATCAFAEHGAAMLSMVLTSRRAIEMSVLIVRTHVRLGDYLALFKDLTRKMEDVERTQVHGEDIHELFGCIEQLLEPVPTPPKRRIGFAPAKP